MKRAAAIVVACLLGGLLAVSVSARAGTPHVRKASLNVVFTLDGTYSNSDTYGPNECNIEGSEQASFAVTFHFPVSKLPLKSGVARSVNGANLSSGSWSQSGIRYDSDTGDCSTGAQPFQCGGKLSIGPISLLVEILKGKVYLESEIAEGEPFGEGGTDSCGGSQYQLPYLGLGDALEPWHDAQAVIPLRKLAAVKKHHSVTLKPRAAGTKTDVASCNGNDGGFGGDEHCTGTLTLSGHALRITVTR